MCVHGSAYVIRWIHALPDIFIIGEIEIWTAIYFNNVSIEQKLKLGAYIILCLIVSKQWCFFAVVLILFSYFFFVLLFVLFCNKRRQWGQFSFIPWCIFKQSPFKYMFFPKHKQPDLPLCFPVLCAVCLSLSLCVCMCTCSVFVSPRRAV